MHQPPERSSRRAYYILIAGLLLLAGVFIWFTMILPRLSGRHGNKGIALNIMKQLASAAISHANAHDGQLPDAGVEGGKEDWAAVSLPAADNIWYNALPRLLSTKSTGDFAREKPAFYSAKNLLFLPGAPYPENRRLDRPYFAFAMNKLLTLRGPDGKWRMAKLSEIQNPARTVLFFERGLPGEPRAHEAQRQRDYDGSPLGGPNDFVARYRKRGFLAFADGHVEEVSGKDLLTHDGRIGWSPGAVDDSSAIFWTADPKQDPNGARE